MRHTCLGIVFNAEIVYDKGEGDAIGGMAEEARRSSLVVAVVGKVFYETLLREESSLGKSIHSFVDFHENGIVVDVVSEAVRTDGGGRNESKRNAHILRT